jgi:OmpA family
MCVICARSSIAIRSANLPWNSLPSWETLSRGIPTTGSSSAASRTQSGWPAHDEKLSLSRARAVHDILAARGVNPRQMLVEGAGAAQPFADNSTPEGRARNRRFELYIDVPRRS